MPGRISQTLGSPWEGRGERQGGGTPEETDGSFQGNGVQCLQTSPPLLPQSFLRLNPFAQAQLGPWQPSQSPAPPVRQGVLFLTYHAGWYPCSAVLWKLGCRDEQGAAGAQRVLLAQAPWCSWELLGSPSGHRPHGSACEKERSLAGHFPPGPQLPPCGGDAVAPARGTPENQVQAGNPQGVVLHISIGKFGNTWKLTHSPSPLPPFLSCLWCFCSQELI